MPTTALYLYAKLALMRTLHRNIVCSLFSYEVVVRPRNEQYVLCLFRKHGANIQKVWELRWFSTLFIEKILIKVCRFQKKHYLCTDKSRPLPIRTAYPAGHFFVYRHEIYQTSDDAGRADSDTAKQRSDYCRLE